MSLVNKTISLKNLSKGFKFYLSKPEILKGINIGTKRYMTNRKFGVKEQSYNKTRPGIDLSIQGVLGEIAAGKIFNVNIEEQISDTTPQNYKNDRGDVICDGKKIDVKTPQGHTNGLWIREQNIKNPSDIYALVSMERENKNEMKNSRKTLFGPGVIDHTKPTFKEDEKISFVFQGAVPFYQAFSQKPKQRGKQKFFIQDQSDLMNLEEAMEKFDNPDQRIIERYKALKQIYDFSFF